jgi:hypothetical protein
MEVFIQRVFARKWGIICKQLIGTPLQSSIKKIRLPNMLLVSGRYDKGMNYIILCLITMKNIRWRVEIEVFLNI